jgi:hypothetical protein
LDRSSSATSSPLNELILEVLDLLTSYWFFMRRSESLATEDPKGVETLEKMVLIQSLIQDIVLRLCKLNDKRVDTWSFRQVVKHMKKNSPAQKMSEDIDPKIAQFENAIKDIKKYHRNNYIAHRSKTRSLPSNTSFNLREAIKLAIDVCDDLRGERVEYKISSDWSGQEIDLREHLESRL